MDLLKDNGTPKIATLPIQLWDLDQIKIDYEASKEKFYIENKEFDESRNLVADRKVNVKKWKERFPNGVTDWARSGHVATLSAKGEQMLVDKLNEIIEAVNNIGARMDALEREMPQIRTTMDNLKNH